jgi:YVTN family beta-propeller protein
MRSILAIAILAMSTMVTAEQGTLIVGNKGEDSISFIDLNSGREVKRAEAGSAPHEVAISPDGKQAAVVAYGGETIHIYDIAERTQIDVIALPPGAKPHGIVWLDDGRVIASAEGIGGIVVATPGSGWNVRTIATDQIGSHMVAVSPDKRYAYTANLVSGSVSKIDLAQGKTILSVPAGEGTEGIAVSPDGSEIWASARASDIVFVFDAATMAKKVEISVGKMPLRIILTPDGAYAVTSNLTDGSLTVIETKTKRVTRTIPILGGQGEEQVTILFNSDGSRLYAALTRINKIAEIDFATGERLGLLSGGAQGDGLAIAPAPSR